MRSILRCFKFILCFLLPALLLACVEAGPTKKVANKEKAQKSFVALGMAYLQQGSRELARRNFEKALELDANSPEAHNGMALVFKMTGEIKLAEEAFLRALNQDSGFTQARFNYAVFLHQQERYQEAFDNFEQVSKNLSYNNRPLALSYVGLTALKLGNQPRAKSAFEHSLNLDGSLAQPMLQLALMNFDEKNYSEAKRYLDQYSAIAKPSPQSLFLGIRIERIFGNKDKEASYVLALKNLHPYSKEYLEYKKLQGE